MQPVTPEPLTDEQRKAAERLVSTWTNWIRLTKIGQPGIRQLRQIFEAERSRVLLMIQADDMLKAPPVREPCILEMPGRGG